MASILRDRLVEDLRGRHHGLKLTRTHLNFLTFAERAILAGDGDHTKSFGGDRPVWEPTFREEGEFPMVHFDGVWSSPSAANCRAGVGVAGCCRTARHFSRERACTPQPRIEAVSQQDRLWWFATVRRSLTIGNAMLFVLQNEVL